MSKHSNQERNETKVSTQEHKVSILFNVFANVWVHICFMYVLSVGVEKHVCNASEAT